MLVRIYFVTFLAFFSEISSSSISSANNIPEFPPQIIISEDENFPTGHLQPLGYQRPPDGPVKEYTKVLRPEEFWEKHVSRSVPLVFRQGIGLSPALSTWTDDYLRENYGELDVLIELKEEDRSHSTRRMNIAEFLARYKQEDIYIVTVLPDPMRRDIQVTGVKVWVNKNLYLHNNGSIYLCVFVIFFLYMNHCTYQSRNPHLSQVETFTILLFLNICLQTSPLGRYT